MFNLFYSLVLKMVGKIYSFLKFSITTGVLISIRFTLVLAQTCLYIEINGSHKASMLIPCIFCMY